MDAYEKYGTAVSGQIVPGTEVKVVKEMQAVDTYELVQKAAVEKICSHRGYPWSFGWRGAGHGLGGMETAADEEMRAGEI